MLKWCGSVLDSGLMTGGINNLWSYNWCYDTVTATILLLIDCKTGVRRRWCNNHRRRYYDIVESRVASAIYSLESLIDGYYFAEARKIINKNLWVESLIFYFLTKNQRTKQDAINIKCILFKFMNSMDV